MTYLQALLFFALAVPVTLAFDPHCPVGSYCPVDLGNLSRNLVMYYPFSKPDRTRDWSGRSGDLIDYGNVEYQSDCAWEGGECSKFVGNSNKYFKLPPINLGRMSRQYGVTICFWVMISQWGDLTSEGVFDFSSSDSNDNVVLKRSWASSYFQLTAKTSSSTILTLNATTLPLNEWRHKCIVTSKYKWSLYTNGSLTFNNTYTLLLKDIDLVLNLLGKTNGGTAMNGSVEEFRIYDRALTPNEVQQVYNFRSYPCPSGSSRDSEGNCSTSIDQSLIAYYPFNTENALKDVAGGLGTLTNVGAVTFQTNCAWQGTQCAVQNSQSPNYQYFDSYTNNFHLQPMQSTSGITACVWFMFPDLSTAYSRVFHLTDTLGLNDIVIARVSINVGYYIFRMYINSILITQWGSTTITPLTGNVWEHACISTQRQTWIGYRNSVAVVSTYNHTNLLNSTGLRLRIGNQWNGNDYNTNARIDEFRLYSRILSDIEVNWVYSLSPISGTPVTCPGIPVSSQCKPCAPGYFQPYPGQIQCQVCSGSSNTYYGAVACGSGSCQLAQQPSQVKATMNGSIIYQVGANYLSFNCPSGTYYNGLKTLPSSTSNCSVADVVQGVSTTCNPASPCCIWASSQWHPVSYLISSAFNGMLEAELAHTNIGLNPFIAIDFKTSQNIKGVFIFDRTDGSCSREDSLMIFVGSTLLPAGSAQKTATIAETPLVYPVSNSSNTLCHTVDPSSLGYRTPYYAPCEVSGRYMYLVGATLNYLNIQEIIVVKDDPPCNPCPVGTFSTSVIPNSVCSDCPEGTYQNTTGASYCITCPVGYTQPNSGQSFCYPAPPAGYYMPSYRNPLESNLIAHYGFKATDPWGDTTGITGPLINVGGVRISDDCVYWGQTCSSHDGTQYFRLPSMNLYSLSNLNGFSVCAWFRFQSMSLGVANEAVFGFDDSVLDNYNSWYFGNGVNWRKVVAANSTYIYASQFSSSRTENWEHVCVTNLKDQWKFRFYLPSETTKYVEYSFVMAPSNVVYTNNVIGGTYSTAAGSTKFIGLISDVRIYNKSLSATEVDYVASYTPLLTCPAGSYQPQPSQLTCIPCPIGYYQGSTGQTSCSTCQYSTWYGTKSCVSTYTGLITSPSTSNSGLPGTALYTVGSNYINLNCPSGTFSNTMQAIDSVLLSCSPAYYSATNVIQPCTSACCYWATSQYAIGGGVDKLTSGVLTEFVWTAYSNLQNEFFAVNFTESLFIDTVILFYDYPTGATRSNKAMILVGDNLIVSSNGQRPDYSTFVYPVNTSGNFLCHQMPVGLTGYTSAYVASCKAKGKYLYLVQNSGSGGYFGFHEWIILTQPVCPLCSPGTYSYNIVPSPKCSRCSAGFFQSGFGKSYCNQCPSGTYQSGLGMTSASSCVVVNSGLIAHYTFTPGARLTDTTGTLGSLTRISNPTYTSSGPWEGSNSAVCDQAGGFQLPSLNLGSLSASTGLSICSWTRFYRIPSVYSNSLFSCLTSSGSDGLIIASVQQGYPSVYVIYSSQTSSIQSIPWGQNIWNHICLTSSNTSFSYYLNGALVGTLSSNFSSVILDSCFLCKDNSTSYYGGSVDAFRIYQKVLSSTEISSLSQHKAAVPCPSTSFCRAGTYCPILLEPTCPYLLHQWAFWTDSRLTDSVDGDLSALVPTGYITYSPVCAYPGAECAVLSPLGGYYTMPFSISIKTLVSSQGVTICSWIMAYSLTEGLDLWAFTSSGSSTSSLRLTLVGGMPKLYVYNVNTAQILTFPFIVVLYKWRHLCVTGLSTTWSIYDMGIQVSSSTSITLGTATLNTNLIGKTYNANTYLDGKIQDFRMYSKALSSEEILSLNASTIMPCPKGHYCPSGVSAPILCPTGKYQASTGMSYCTSCPLGYYSTISGATSIDACTACT